MNITEMLMNGKVEEAGKRAKGTFRSKELARICGVEGAVTVEFTALSPKRVKQIMSMASNKDGSVNYSKANDIDLLFITDAVTNPDLKDKKLRDRYGCTTPKDLAEKLFGNETPALSTKIAELSQPDEDESDEEMVKN